MISESNAGRAVPKANSFLFFLSRLLTALSIAAAIVPAYANEARYTLSQISLSADHLDFDREGRRLLVASPGEISVYDVEQGTELFRRAPAELIADAALSPDGGEVALALRENGARTYAVDGDSTERTIDGEWQEVRYSGDGAGLIGRRTYDVVTNAFGPDYDTVFAGGDLWPIVVLGQDNTLALSLADWRVALRTVPAASGETLRDGVEGRSLALLLYRQAATGDFVVVYLDAGVGKILAKQTVPALTEPKLKHFRMTPAGPRAVFWLKGETTDQVLVYDPSTNETVYSLILEPDAYHEWRGVALSGDGKLLAMQRREGPVDIFVVDDSYQPATPAIEESAPRLVLSQGHEGVVRSVALSPDGAFMATAGFHDHRTLMWRVDSGRQIYALPVELADNAALSFSPDGETLLALGGDTASFWSAREGKLKQRFVVNQSVWGQYTGAGDTILLCGTVECALGPARSHATLTAAIAPLPVVMGVADLKDADVSRDGSKAALAVDEDGVLLLDLAHFRDARHVHPSLETAGTAAVSDGGVVAVAGDGNRIVLIDFATGNETGRFVIPAERISRIRFLPDDGLLIFADLAGEGTAAYFRHDPVTGQTARLPVAVSPTTFDESAGVLAVSFDGGAFAGAVNSGFGFSSLVETGKLDGGRPEKIEFSAFSPQRLEFSGDGKSLHLSGIRGFVTLDLEQGSVRTVDIPGYGRNSLVAGDGILFLSEHGKNLVFKSPRLPAVALARPESPGAYASLSGTFRIAGGRVVALEQTNDADRLISYDLKPVLSGEPEPGRLTTLAHDLPYSSEWLLSPDAETAVFYGLGETIVAADRVTGSTRWTRELRFRPDAVAFSADGRFVLAVDEGVFSRGAILDAATGEEVRELVRGVTGSDGFLIANTALEKGVILRLSTDDRVIALDLAGDDTDESATLSALRSRFAVADGEERFLLVAGYGGRVVLWNRLNGQSLMLDAAPLGRGSVAFDPAGKLLAMAESDGLVSLWRLETGERIAQVSTFGDGSWAVVDTAGRYDASDPGNMPALSWVMPDAPDVPVPLELFYREYYEPRLLPRLLASEDFGPRKSPDNLNRLQPLVSIVGVEPATEAGRVDVTVEVKSQIDGSSGSGVAQVKLFRDGQMVARTSPGDELLVAQQDAAPRRLTFPKIRLPGGGADDMRFSAYAFNADGIKSETAEFAYRKLATGETRSRTAYVVAVGIDTYSAPSWRLRYAGADAKASLDIVAAGLKAGGQFDRVVAVPLITSDGQKSNDATRARIEAVLERLGGGEPDAALLAGIPGTHDLQPADPDDMVYFSFAGHGFAAEDGRFHLFPADIGNGEALDAILASHTIDSDRLTDLFQAIDAGTFVLVIDACNSAATVQTNGFKPGPMGSRGLGQLAYDKGMRILTASQVEGFALESDLLRHGALTFSMLREGYEAGQADVAPKDGLTSFDELFAYSLTRVPELYADIGDGVFDTAARSAVSKKFKLEGGGTARLSGRDIPQRPALFDFRPDRRVDVLIPLR